jgi:hypothetical protein
MGRFGTFILGFLLGGATVFGSLHYHVVRANDGVHFIPKMSSTFTETLVDIRSFGFEEWNQHRSLAFAIQQAGKTELLQGVALQPVQNAVDGMRDILSGNR